MNIDNLTKLRQKSGLGLLECKSALEEADGNLELAESNLRKRGLSKMDGRVDREATEGRVALGFCGSKGVLLQVLCETDFAAKSDAFTEMLSKISNELLSQSSGVAFKSDEIQNIIDDCRLATGENVSFGRGYILDGGFINGYVHHNGKLGVIVQLEGTNDANLLHKLALHIASVDPEPICIDEGGVPEELLRAERDIAEAQVEGKPEHIVEKIVQGKLNKFLDSVVLLRQSFVMDTSKKIKDLLPEGVSIKAFGKSQIGQIGVIGHETRS